ncbi:MAG TPA: hypothetical protein VMY37_30005 [Thermoguttaceae bacterium]|nr:hypothetical protein [Thermoguttaceae bacterium]
MATSGSPSQWADFFPENLVPDVLILVVSSWEELDKPQHNEHEVSITKRFLPVLRRNKGLRRLPFAIDRETWLDDEAATEHARLDLRFQHGHREDVYLAFECKRLNVKYESGFRSEASKYVHEGMSRFMEHKYARGLRQGGMIGYVMDGDVDAAVRAIEGQFRDHKKLLLLRVPKLARSSLVPDNSNIRETTHHGTGRPFRIHHLFLA